MKIVDKDALVAVIERLRKCQRLEDRHDQGVLDGIHAIEKTVGTLEVKEVDFGMELCKYMGEHFNVYYDGNQTLQTKDKKSLIGRVDVENIAKHFFELGLKAQKGE